MRIERYYSSLREELSPMKEEAVGSLNNQDYVSFFKACGPTYIRSIRRAQEVTAIFSFETTSDQDAQQYAANLQVAVGEWSKVKPQFTTASNTLQINIVGFGLGLSEEGSETLVADSLPEYKKVMRFAFDSMTRGGEYIHIGMVYGMEVVPWSENVMFQVSYNQ